MADFPKVYCPYCAGLATHTVESIQALASLHEDNGGLSYAGDTDVDWNSQQTVTLQKGKYTVFWCRSCQRDFAATAASGG